MAEVQGGNGAESKATTSYKHDSPHLLLPSPSQAHLLEVGPHLCQVLPPLHLLPLRRPLVAAPAPGARRCMPARLSGAGCCPRILILLPRRALRHWCEHRGRSYIGGGRAAAGLAAAVAAVARRLQEVGRASRVAAAGVPASSAHRPSSRGPQIERGRGEGSSPRQLGLPCGSSG